MVGCWTLRALLYFPYPLDPCSATNVLVGDQSWNLHILYGCCCPYPEGPSTQYSRTLVPKTMKGMVFGTRDLKYWVLGPSGLHSRNTDNDTGACIISPILGTGNSANSHMPGHRNPRKIQYVRDFRSCPGMVVGGILGILYIHMMIPNHIISYHIISYHIISYHIISYHIISYHIISYHIISYHIISYHIISYHIRSYHIMSYWFDMIWYHIISYPILSYRIASYRIASHRIASYHIRSDRVISYHTISYQIIWYMIVLALSFLIL